LDLLHGKRLCDLKSAAFKKGSKEQWYECLISYEIDSA
jgi:hypothetical protein